MDYFSKYTMKTLMMNRLQLSVYLRFCARLLVLLGLFITGMLYSQNNFSSDSDIFIAKGSYLYIDSSAYISVSKSAFQSRKKALRKKAAKIFAKVSPVKHSTVNNRIIISSCYKKIPERSSGFSLPGSTLSMGILDYSSPVHPLQKMVGSTFAIFFQPTHIQKKRIFSTNSSFRRQKITVSRFSRPPPFEVF